MKFRMLALLFAGACLLLTPGAALAGKNTGRRNQVADQTSGGVTALPASTSTQSPNGVGIGKGGVPAMRDGINERLDGLDQAVADLDDRTTALEGAVSAIDTQLQDLDAQVQGIDAVVQSLDTLLTDLDDRVAFLEGLTVDDDLDGFSEIHDDCDDADPSVFPGATEVPANGIDDDCDGTIDETT